MGRCGGGMLRRRGIRLEGREEIHDSDNLVRCVHS